MWLMLQSEIDRIEAILSSPITASMLDGKVASEAEPMEVLPGGIAVIKVNGPLMPERSAWLDFFGVQHTAYKDIVSQTKSAVERGSRRIRYDVNSPGGTVDGMADAMDAIRNAGIPTRAVAKDKMASAAYMLASQTDNIVASGDMTLIGSVGVVSEISVDPMVRKITNTDSPRKRPDLDTPEGVADVRDQLDDIFGVLAERIAAGRKTTVEAVKENYGKGAVFTARKALEHGMIDYINKPKVSKPKPAEESAEALDFGEGAEEGEVEMNEDTMKAEAYQSGFDAGIKQERDRVVAHLMLGKASGDMDGAIADVSSGEGLTAIVNARHVAAGIKKQQIEARANEAPPAVGHDGTPAPAATQEAKDLSDLQGRCKNFDFNIGTEA